MSGLVGSSAPRLLDIGRVLPAILEAANELSPRQALSSSALRYLWAALAGDSVRRTVETGGGASTAVFSQASERHWCFTNDVDSVARLRASPLVRGDTVRFVVGPSQRMLAAAELPDGLDAVLLDGPHAYPFPQLEYFCLYPRLRPGGWLVLDDLQIRSVRELYWFLRREEMFRMEMRVGRTAFFRRTEAPGLDPWGDGWERQASNRRRLPEWPDWAGAVGRRIGRLRSGARVAMAAPLEPVDGEVVVEGRARLPEGADLWVLARREGQGGWWPQGGDRALVDGGGRWRVRVQLGEPRDAGGRFEVLAAVVGTLTTARWRGWVAAGDSGPVQLPPRELILAERLRKVSRRPGEPD